MIVDQAAEHLDPFLLLELEQLGCTTYRFGYLAQ